MDPGYERIQNRFRRYNTGKLATKYPRIYGHFYSVANSPLPSSVDERTTSCVERANTMNERHCTLSDDVLSSSASAADRTNHRQRLNLYGEQCSLHDRYLAMRRRRRRRRRRAIKDFDRANSSIMRQQY